MLPLQPLNLVMNRSMLALPPSKLVVHPAYPDTLKQYLDISNQLQGSPPGNEFQIQSLKAGDSAGCKGRRLCQGHCS
jgi:hypothetical protein